MVTYIMEKNDFINEYKVDGKRDRFYTEKYGRPLGLPTNITTGINEEGMEVITKCTELCVSGIKNIHDRTYVTLTDEHGTKIMDINQAIVKLSVK